MKLKVIQQWNIWRLLYSVIVLSGIISIVFSWQQIGTPLRLNVDLVGGTRLQFERDCNKPGNCDRPIDINIVREVAKANGLGNSSIQVVADKNTGKEDGVSIRTKNIDIERSAKLQNALSEKIGAFDLQKTQIDSVSPILGRQLFTSNLLALIASLFSIFLYLKFRFQLDYAVFAIVAVFHDISITVAILSIFSLVIGAEVDSLFIVALLTIAGFSIQKTVVIYDQIRETINLNPHCHIKNIVDDAVDRTLVQSINSTLAILLSLFATFLFGGETLKSFVLALIIGFTVGTYSSIFITSNLLVLWRESTNQAIPAGPVEKEFKAFD